MRIIGDVHGKYKRYKKLIKDTERSVQVGDMGVGFKYLRAGEWHNAANPPFDAMSKGQHYFIRGNHDNPESCDRHPYWIPDGYASEGVFYLGGAVSVDRAYRTKGADWWEDEECSVEQLEEFLEAYKYYKPKIMITHDCPESIALDIMRTYRKEKIGIPSRTRNYLDQMFYHHQPKLWVFGHWHTTMNFVRNGTMFQCLGELDYIDIDLKNPLNFYKGT